MPSTRGGAGAGPRAGVLRRLGEWCAHHFVVVIVAWLVALVVLQIVSRAVGGTYSDNFTLSDSQSQKGIEVLQRHDPQAGGYSSQIVLRDDQQELTALGSQMSSTVSSLEKLPHVLSAQNPLTAQGSSSTGSSQPDVGPLSTDKRTAYITVRFDVQPSTLGDGYLSGVDDAVRPLREAGAQVEYGGPLGELARPAPDDRVSELIGFGVAVVVLLIGFGSVIAAVMPLLTALIAVVAGLAVLGLLARPPPSPPSPPRSPR